MGGSEIDNWDMHCKANLGRRNYKESKRGCERANGLLTAASYPVGTAVAAGAMLGSTVGMPVALGLAGAATIWDLAGSDWSLSRGQHVKRGHLGEDRKDYTHREGFGGKKKKQKGKGLVSDLGSYWSSGNANEGEDTESVGWMDCGQATEPGLKFTWLIMTEHVLK